MSAWIQIAEAVAAANGISDDLFVRDRIGRINEDNLSGRDVAARELKNGEDGVTFGGQGIGGNAVARFGDSENSLEAAEEFAAIINSLKSLGLTEEVLVNDDLSFTALAEGAGAVFERDLIGSIAEGVDLPFNVTERESDGLFAVGAGGGGVGGNATARFESSDQAQAFADLLNLLEDAGFQDELFGL